MALSDWHKLLLERMKKGLREDMAAYDEQRKRPATVRPYKHVEPWKRAGALTELQRFRKSFQNGRVN